MTVLEVAVDVPAILDAKQARQRKSPYRFHLTEDDLQRVSGLGDAAVVAYAVIRAAAWGDREHQWVKVSRRAAMAVDRGYRWWHGATSRLHEAGLMDVQRHRGVAPRYRLRRRAADRIVSADGGDRDARAPPEEQHET